MYFFWSLAPPSVRPLAPKSPSTRPSALPRGAPNPNLPSGRPDTAGGTGSPGLTPSRPAVARPAPRGRALAGERGLQRVPRGGGRGGQPGSESASEAGRVEAVGGAGASPVGARSGRGRWWCSRAQSCGPSSGPGLDFRPTQRADLLRGSRARVPACVREPVREHGLAGAPAERADWGGRGCGRRRCLLRGPALRAVQEAAAGPAACSSLVV